MHITQLSSKVLFPIFERVSSFALINIALTSRSMMLAVMNYMKQQDSARQRGFGKLASQIFISLYRQKHTLFHALFHISDPLTSTTFIMELPKATVSGMMSRGHLGAPEKYPHEVDVDVMCEKLPLEYLEMVWLKRVYCDEMTRHTFSNPDDDKRFKALYVNDDDHTHLSKLTMYIMVRKLKRMQVDDRFMRILAYWMLVDPMMELCAMRNFYHVHLNQILPWIMMFPSKQRKELVISLASDFDLGQLCYISRHLMTPELVGISSGIKINKNFKAFINGLDRTLDREYISWLTSKPGLKLIKALNET